MEHRQRRERREERDELGAVSVLASAGDLIGVPSQKHTRFPAEKKIPRRYESQHRLQFELPGGRGPTTAPQPLQ